MVSYFEPNFIEKFFFSKKVFSSKFWSRPVTVFAKWKLVYNIGHQVSSMLPIQNSGYLTFLLLANVNRYANEVLNMRIGRQQTTWVVLALHQGF